MKKNVPTTRILQDDVVPDAELDYESYDAFLENWQELASDENQSDKQKHEQLEALSKSALAKLVQPNSDNEAGYSANPIFNSLGHAAVICDQSGIIEQVNTPAQIEFGLSKGVQIDDLQIVDQSESPLSAHVAECGKNASNSEINIVQCVQENGATLNLIFLALPSKPDVFDVLIVFLSASWGSETRDLFVSKFGLTDVEADVIGEFARGIGLKQLSEMRGRAYATIRNQFQSAMTKTGCLNQSDLLRLMLGTSFLFSQINVLSQDSPPQLGKAVEMMRPEGRFLDVRLFGDPKGRPFVCFPSLFGLPVTPTIEKHLKERKLLMLGVARPGIGGTSPPPANQSVHECLAADIAALLDSMEIEECVFVGRASAARTMFNLANLIPERMSRAYMVNSLIPRPYVERTNVLSKWTRSLMSASRVSQSMATVILGAGKKLMIRHGVDRFVGKLYRESQTDVAAVNNPEVAESIRLGADYTIEQGLFAGVHDMVESFDDWSNEVQIVKMPVTLVQGVEDPQVPFAASRAFANDFPDQVKLVAIDGGGGLLNYSHYEEIFDIMELPKAA